MVKLKLSEGVVVACIGLAIYQHAIDWPNALALVFALLVGHLDKLEDAVRKWLTIPDIESRFTKLENELSTVKSGIALRR